MAELDSGLFSISISDGDDSAPEAADPSKSTATTTTTTTKVPGTARVAQSEESFEAVRQAYSVKVENGEIWKEIQLPLGGRIAKPEAQALLHAVEELYFLKRYEEGAAFVGKVLDGEDGVGGLDKEVRKTLAYYQGKCEQQKATKGE